MTASDILKNFPKQFGYEPVIENAKALKRRRFEKIIIAGMGGSHLAADLLKTWNPSLDIVIHKDYGLPMIPPKAFKDSLVIASSFSGNTEETISAFQEALKNKLAVAAITAGGKLLKLAQKYKKPYIHLPASDMPPRLFTGLMTRALFAFLKNEKALEELRELSSSLKSYECERLGKTLARKLSGYVPVIYSSARNAGIAYNWKVRFNETAGIPAFFNVFPELSHTELAGFDAVQITKESAPKFYFIFLKDVADNPKIVKRMNITERLYRERGLPVEVLMLGNKNPWREIFFSVVSAEWTAYYLAKERGVKADEISLVEEFKELMKNNKSNG